MADFRSRALVSLATLFVALPLQAQRAVKQDNECHEDVAPFSVKIDSVRHEAVLKLGPCRVVPMPLMMDMPGMNHMLGHHGNGGEDVKIRFRWPADVHLHGFKLTITDSLGRQLPQHTMHHLQLVNYDRRQIVYPMAERVFGIGEETADVNLPRSVGLPLVKDQEMGLFVMWNNLTDDNMDGVTLTLTMPWIPHNLAPRPLAVFPFKADVNSTPGKMPTFDIPPGKSSRSSTFTVATDGRLLGIGGHMHDQGAELRLEEVSSGKLIGRVVAHRKPDGIVTGVSRQLFGIKGRGPHLRAGKEYRIVAVYNNVTGATIQGAMAMFGGLFAPDDPRRWPPVDRNHPDYILDLASGAGRATDSPLFALGRLLH